jgi:hypothetical protein
MTQSYTHVSFCRKYIMSVMYDMVSHKYITPTKQRHKEDDIMIFMNKYLEANIRQDDEYLKWVFIYHYTRQHISKTTVDRIILRYNNQKLTNNFISNYNNVYDNLDIINKKDLKNEKEDIIKMNMVMLILYNKIHTTSYIY